MLETASDKKKKEEQKLHKDVTEIIKHERLGAQKGREVELLQAHQNRLRHAGRSMQAESLSPHIRLNSVESQDHREASQKLTHRLKEKVAFLKESGRADKGKELHTQLAEQYKHLHYWANAGHTRNKSPTLLRARDEFYNRHMEHQRLALKQ